MSETREDPDLTVIDETHVLVTPKRKPGRPKKVQPVATLAPNLTIATAPVSIHTVLAEIQIERAEQDAKWGEQSHPLIGTDNPDSMRKRYETQANHWKAVNDSRAKNGVSGWDGILLEEALEALAESDPAKARAELVQVAAVAVAMIEHIDRSVQL